MMDRRRTAQAWTLLFDALIVMAAPLTIGYVIVETIIDRKISLVLVAVAVAAFLWLSDVRRRRRPVPRRSNNRRADG
ncbi:MAG: hypothetical protein NVSMB48_08130 [Marmoricola sp.]